MTLSSTRTRPVVDQGARREKWARGETWAWGSAVAAVVVVVYIAILLHDPRYFYIDDTASGAVGNWIQLGHLMREGHFPSLVLDQWMSGNYPVEGQGGLWNPPQMLINFISPSVDNLALLAAGVKLVFSVILAWGVYRVAMAYGARPSWAAVVGAAVPFTGFSLFFEQPSWVTSLIGMAWGIQAWASGVKYARGQSGPIPTFIFLYLAISVGYVHAALVAGVITGSLMIGEFVAQKHWQPALKLGVVGIAAASCGAITYLPGVLTSAVTWRTGQDGTLNDNFLTAPWSETLTASIPSSVASIQAWGSETIVSPITYIGWFLIPGLAFIAWRKVPPVLRGLTTPLIVLSFALLFTAGPSAIGQIRWPARLLPLVALSTLILFAVLVSKFGTLRPTRPRLVAAGLLLLFQVIRASSSGPQFFGRHMLSALFIIVAGGLAIFVARRFGAGAISMLLLCTITPVALYQVSTYRPPVSDWYLPGSQSEAKAGFPAWQGTTMQLGTRSLTGTTPDSPDLPWHSQVYGNYAKVLDLDYVNAYTPVGFQKFAALLCVQYEGSTCDDAYVNLFAKDPYTQRPIADLMRLDRVVIQKAQYPGLDSTPAPDGWHWITPPQVTRGQVYVLERLGQQLSDTPGRLAATVDATAEHVASNINTETARVSSPNGGSVVFSRLAWPGYTATLDGKPLQTKGLGGVFLYVDLPPGTQNAVLDIDFRPPGQRIGFAGIGFGVILLAGLVIVEVRRRRKDPGRKDQPGVEATTTVSL